MQKKNFNLDNKFYPQDIVLEAIEAFSDFQIQITAHGVEIQDDVPVEIFDEFSNYCITLLNERID